MERIAPDENVFGKNSFGLSGSKHISRTLGNKTVVFSLCAPVLQTGLTRECTPDVLMIESTDLVPLAAAFCAFYEGFRFHLVIDQLIKTILLNHSKIEKQLF